MLIKMIFKKDNDFYILFYNVLLYEGYKDFVVFFYDGIFVVFFFSGKDLVSGIILYVRIVLCEGGVLQRLVVFVIRKKLVNVIQQKFFKLKGELGWVIIYGMVGCGKFVLVVEVVRDYFFLEDCFLGGVYWVLVGK